MSTFLCIEDFPARSSFSQITTSDNERRTSIGCQIQR